MVGDEMKLGFGILAYPPSGPTKAKYWVEDHKAWVKTLEIVGSHGAN